ncbi:MAG: tetratricopeptide repeat protein, partial [Betaproteobacteria bacterium]|nr:tetratricopeptide repeat protein [Betaproteobacteria bacterium]
MTPSSLNNESYSTLRWVLKNAKKGFYLYTATHPMQRRVAEHFSSQDIAIYDYSQHNMAYSFGVLAQWAMRQKCRAFFVINMQVALEKEKDIINLNLSRDLLSEIDGIWIFGMTPDADNRLVKIAHDFYSFIRLQPHFEDEGIESETPTPILSSSTLEGYYDSYAEAEEQMQRYAGLRDELLALPLDAAPETLLSAAITLENIAELYGKYGHYDDAMKLSMRIKTIREMALGIEHPDTATTYNNIANVFDSQGDYGKALEWHEKALAIKEKVLGKEHPDTAKTYNNIALIYHNQGNYDKALEWHEKALAINEKVLGKEHPSTATTYNNIALIYHNQGNYDKALEWHEKALAIREKVLGKEHPDTAATYNNIALIYDSQGNYDKALEWHEKALAISEKVLG